MQDNQLIKISNPFEPFKRDCLPIPYETGRTISDLVKVSGFGDSVIVLHNGNPAKDLSRVLLPGDVIHIYPQLHNDTALRTIGLIGIAVIAAYVVGPAVSGVFGGGYIGGIAGGVATVATITAGGMILNSGLSSANTSSASKQEQDSPTYHWDIKENLAREGLAIPVIYGNVASHPIVINQWLEVISGEQWAHTVLCVGEGKTNNEPTIEDIYAADQKLSLYDTDDYTLVTTDGGASPNWGSARDFTTPHQMRSVDRQMKHAIVSNFLLHCNGVNGSQVFDDDSDTNNDNQWISVGLNNITLSTSNPFLGTACLNMPTDCYLYCLTGGGASNYEAFNIWEDEFFCIETRFRQSTLANCGIMGQSRIVSGGDEYYWGLFYNHDETKIYFQQYKVTSGGAYTVYYSNGKTVTLSDDTWYHICIQKWGSNQLRFYLNGEQLGSAVSVVNTLVDPPAGAWNQGIGRAMWYDGATTNTMWYGEKRLDEIRLVSQGTVYPTIIPTDFTPPNTELEDNASEEYVFTSKGTIDKFGIIITAPFGIYYANDDGSITPHYVSFHISYRKTNTSDAWQTDYQLFWGESRNPWRMRFDFTMPSRGKYDIMIRRSAVDYTDARHQTTTMLSYIDEYLDIDLTYPYLQCVGLSLRAQDLYSGQIPPFRVVSNRDSIVVPSYAGDTTRTVDPTVNANSVFDMLTNLVYGPGVDESRINSTDWEEWVDWCNTTIDGDRRSQLNMIFDQASTLDDALQQVENCGRARIVRRGIEISCNIDKPLSPVALFGAGNIKPGSDHVRWVRQAERADAIEISYRDKDLDFVEQTMPAKSSGFHSLSRVPRIVRIPLPGINNKNQAKREAILRQQINDSIKKSVELESGLEAIPVISGDVINYQASINSFTGRLPLSDTRAEEWTGTTIYLDQEVNLASSIYSGNCIIMIRDPDDTMQTYTVTGPFDTDSWTVTISASNTFNYLSPYTICRNTGDVYQYKIINMQRSGKLDIKLNGLQYDSSAYYNDDYQNGGVAI